MKAERYWPAVPESIWERIRDEFTLPDLGEVGARFEEMVGESDTLMRQVVRVFIGEGTFCPGFQFKEGLLDPAVLRLFDRALALGVPHNVFAAWMVTPLRALDSARPVDALGQGEQLEAGLAAFADWYRPRPAVPKRPRTA